MSVTVCFTLCLYRHSPYIQTPQILKLCCGDSHSPLSQQGSLFGHEGTFQVTALGSGQHCTELSFIHTSTHTHTCKHSHTVYIEILSKILKHIDDLACWLRYSVRHVSFVWRRPSISWAECLFVMHRSTCTCSTSQMFGNTYSFKGFSLFFTLYNNSEDIKTME